MHPYLRIALLSLTICLLFTGISFLIKYIVDRSRKLSNPPNFFRIKQEQESAIIRIPPQNRKSLSQTIATVPKNQQILANFSILTAYNPGYIGPYRDGVYSEIIGTNTALDLGARSFFLTIDSDSTWKPYLVQRTTTGVRINLDSFKMDGQKPVAQFGGDPAQVLQTLANNAFRNTNDPLLIYLYFERTPDLVSKEKEYVAFLSKIAKMLLPFREFHLRTTERGDYTRQRSADTLLLAPIEMYMKKVLIFTNVDTTVFRKAAYAENEDLDFWSHMQFYSNNTIGSTSPIKDSNLIRGYLDNISYYVNTPTNKYTDVVSNTKINYNVALSKEQTVSLDNAKLMLEKLGVQSIPVNIFEPTNKPVVDLYKGTSFLVKPEAIRFTIPEPIKIAAQNPKMNSNGGMINTPQIPM